MEGIRFSKWANNRNKAKPFRPQRVNEDGSIHWADNMRLSSTGKPVNSTGCYGIKSTFAVRAKTFGPRTGKRRDKKRKNVCRLISTGDILRLDKRYLESLKQIRGNILTIKIIGDFLGKNYITGQLASSLERISSFIFSESNREEIVNIYKQDEQRANSILGRLRKNQIKGAKVKGILNRLKFIKV